MMDDMSENAKSEQYQEKTGRESNPIGVAAVILLLCICFLIFSGCICILRIDLFCISDVLI